MLVSDVAAPHAKDIPGVRVAAVLVQGREAQGGDREGSHLEAARCTEKLHDGEQLLRLRPGKLGWAASRYETLEGDRQRLLPGSVDDEGLRP